MKRILSVIALIGLAASFARSQEMTHAGADGDPTIYSPTEIKWKDGPDFLPAGAKFAVLEGDPTKEGPFVIRIIFPAGFKIQPHSHPKIERVTVLSGTLNLGMGEKFDQSATRELPAGTYGFWPAGMRHFAWVKNKTTVQLHGIGPWIFTYVNPADDPRNMKK